MKLEFYGKVDDDGVLTLRNRKQLKEDLKELKGVNVTVSIEKTKKNRSESQSRFYWGVVVSLIRERFIELGNQVSKEETHDYLKHEFNYKELVDEKTGAIYRFPMSTANLSTSEFMDYIARIQVFSATVLDLVIPDPGQQLEIL